MNKSVKILLGLTALLAVIYFTTTIVKCTKELVKPAPAGQQINQQFQALQDSLTAYRRDVKKWQAAYEKAAAAYDTLKFQMDVLIGQNVRFFNRNRQYIKDFSEQYEREKAEMDSLMKLANQFDE